MAGISVATAWVDLVPSMRGSSKTITKEAGAAGQQASKTFGSTFGRGLKSAIGPALAVVGTAAVGSFLNGAVNEASDLNETISKSSVIFGKNAKSIERFGNTAAESLGLSKNEAIAAAASFGDMFSQIGFGGKAAADMSKDVVQLSADLGSFNNLETADVADRISAAFRGEYDSLQAVIPNINAARVESEALATTGKKTAKELTAQEKAAAVLAIVHKDGARAAGDFARTSGGLANQQKILQAKTADLKATIGSALLPVVTKVATYLNDEAVPAVSDFVSGMQDGTGSGGKVADALKDVYTAARPVAMTIVGVVKAFAGLPGGTQKVILLAGAALLLKSRFDGAIPSLQNFDRTSVAATAKTVAFRGGAIAAAGGLAALTTQVGGSTTALGGLSTIGAGVAAGFAVGGPWGAAIGGAGGLLTILTSKSSQAAAAQAKLKAGADQVATTLDRQTGAMTSLTRATTAKALADSGAFTEAKRVGASYTDVLNAALGSESATKRVKKAIDDYSDSQGNRLGVEARVAKSTENLRGAIGETSSAIAEERRRILQVNEAMGDLDGKTASIKVIVDTGTAGAQLGSILGQLNKIDKKKASSNAYASGTNNAKPGLAVVGEKGPELMVMNGGEKVYTAKQTRGILAARPAGELGAQASTSGLSPRDIRRALDGMTLRIAGLGNARLSAAGA